MNDLLTGLPNFHTMQQLRLLQFWEEKLLAELIKETELLNNDKTYFLPWP